jgi:peptide-methionine (S)-S-oxide reductase
MGQDGSVLVLGGGCFWCTDAVFRQVRGVLALECGYSNGHLPQPSYEQVCSGRSGHAEVVRLQYDPQQVSTRTLLEIFFATHDPTTPNRQGHDVGPQYRSGIYTTTPEQAQQARALIAELEAARVFERPIVTEVLPLANYWPAEDYHQNYYARHPQQGYCAHVIAPKLAQFRQRYAALLKPQERA